MSKELYIGVMSGTSLDGVDVVLCEIDAIACTLLYSIEYPMPQMLKENILKTIESQNSLEAVGRLDIALAELFYEAILFLINKYSLETSNIKAIGLHGQTLWHAPNINRPFSMQLGDPNLLTAKLNICVVANFRQKDIALGGQGAPFAPAFHQFLFSQKKEKIAVINIGGMANITILGEKLLGYDTGCGNVLLDLWIGKNKNLSYDKDGLWAKSGNININLLENMLEDEYFSMPYPKSTGREKFNEVWLMKQLSILSSVNQTDIQRTLLELTALTISNEIKKFSIDSVFLCGGGARNTFLVEQIKEHLVDVNVTITKNVDTMEAMTFAWLAYKRIHKEKINLKEVTGARCNSILGGIYE